jgi:hypothetical protein
MVHYRLRDDDQARHRVSEAKRWIEAANHATEDDPSGTRPVCGGWHEPVIFPLLLREAEKVLKGDP